MKFRSGKYRSRGLVVQAATRVILPTREHMTTQGLRVQFEGYRFDSEAAQRLYGWTDEQREVVEKALLEHSDFNRPGGFFLDEGQELPLWAQDRTADEKPVCMFITMEEDTSEPCGKAVVEGEMYCVDHLGFVADIVSQAKKPTRKEKVSAATT